MFPKPQELHLDKSALEKPPQSHHRIKVENTWAHVLVDAISEA